MFKSRLLLLVIVSLCFNVVAVLGATLEEDWNDFIHYTAIGRYDLAEGYAQVIVDSDPDPVELLRLSEANPNGFGILVKVYNNSDQLKELAGEILDIIEQGRFVLRTDPAIIKEELVRLSTTIRGRLEAEQRLKNAGEYAVPFFLDAISDPARKNELPYITDALGKMSRDAIRPLVASLQMDNVATKIEVVRALGKIGYEQSLPYLKYIYEADPSQQLKEQAKKSIDKIDPAAMKISAAKLFFKLANDYYYGNESLLPNADYDFANVWFWDVEAGRLKREKVSKDYFNELMAMRSSEWALKADEQIGEAISLWIAAFFNAEKQDQDMPAYFGDGHPDAMTYATTAGPEYLHEALSRALKDKNDYLALNLVEALAVNAGESSLLYRFGTEQPLVAAMSCQDISVRYSSAIAIGSAGPSCGFVGSKLIIKNLSEAIVRDGQDMLGEELAAQYADRAIDVLAMLAVSGNDIVDVSQAQPSLLKVLANAGDNMKVKAADVLAYLDSPDAQRAVANAALNESFSEDVRLSFFASLIKSAKKHGQMLTDSQIDSLYALSASREISEDIRSAAAGAYGALNLPSKKVKNLILDQAKS